MLNNPCFGECTLRDDSLWAAAALLLLLMFLPGLFAYCAAVHFMSSILQDDKAADACGQSPQGSSCAKIGVQAQSGDGLTSSCGP